MDAYLRSCEICDDVFLACRERGFNRQYCEAKCTKAARVESCGRAKAKDRKKTRGTPEGRERHNREVREYRAKKRRQRVEAGERVGDQLSRPIEAPRMVAGMTHEPPEPLSATASAVQPAAAPVSSPSAAQPAPVSWTVIAVPRLAALAREWLESARVICCACCGRPGRVTRVVVKSESPWAAARKAYLRQRRGLG